MSELEGQVGTVQAAAAEEANRGVVEITAEMLDEGACYLSERFEGPGMPYFTSQVIKLLERMGMEVRMVPKNIGR